MNVFWNVLVQKTIAFYISVYFQPKEDYFSTYLGYPVINVSKLSFFTYPMHSL